jgi:hypothetical protein
VLLLLQNNTLCALEAEPITEAKVPVFLSDGGMVSVSGQSEGRVSVVCLLEGGKVGVKVLTKEFFEIFV